MQFSAKFTIVGAAEEQPLVEAVMDPIAIVGIGMAQRQFTVVNRAARPVTFNVTTKVEGTGAAKVAATVLDNVLTVPANGRASTTLNVQTSEPLAAGDAPTVEVAGAEGV